MGRIELWWIALCVMITAINGWGEEGHFMVCKIAESYLTKDSLAAIKTLLPDRAEGDLANVCSWPDEVRRTLNYRWSSPLHFIDTPEECNYYYCRDCHDTSGHKDRCVTGAIYNYTMQLKEEYHSSDLSVAKYNLTEAIMFLSHYIGDVHQPLHVAFTRDGGGNTIIVSWYGQRTNLHHVWDDMIIDSALKTFYNSNTTTMINSIQSNITDALIDELSGQSCNGTVCPDPYASESISLACEFAYPNATSGSTLGDDYFLSRLPIVETRLAQGGVRLAALLNHIFAAPSSLAQE